MAGDGLTRTSRSALLDRHVRVDRRLRVDDGAFGTYPAWTTIVDRYLVRLSPDATQRHDRKELGDQLADSVQQSFRALGEPSRNGRTIRQGDRFVDLVNNRCYDIVAVIRNRGRSPYSAMWQFELRLVADGCPEVSIPYDNADAGGALPEQTHFIMRHLANDEIFGWELLPYFDGVVYNLQVDDPLQLAEIAALVAAGRRWWRYYAILDYPFSGTLFGGTSAPLATWFNYLRDNLQFSGSASHRRFRVADTVALFAAYTGGDGQKRELIPHGLMTAGERAAMVSQMVSLALAPGGVLAPASGVFLDQAWLNVHDFQVESNLSTESGHGDTKEGSPKLTALPYAGVEAAFGDGGAWATHRAAMVSLYAEVAAALGPDRYPIFNGEHRTQSGDTIPKPWMFENAFDNNVDVGGFEGAKTGFATDPRNILSILCSAAPNATIGVPEALAHWQATGGWISFTSDSSPAGLANLELAYAEAAAILASLGFPR